MTDTLVEQVRSRAKQLNIKDAQRRGWAEEQVRQFGLWMEGHTVMGLRLELFADQLRGIEGGMQTIQPQPTRRGKAMEMDAAMSLLKEKRLPLLSEVRFTTTSVERVEKRKRQIDKK